VQSSTVVTKENKVLIAWLLLILLAVMWGSSFIIIKRALPFFTPVQIGSLRIFAAGLVFLPVILSKYRVYPKDKTQWFVWSGLLGYLLPAYLFSYAQTHISSSLSGTLNSATPLFVLIVGALFFQKKILKWQVVGLVLGFIGSLMLILSSGKGEGLSFGNPWALLVIAAAVMYGFNVNIVGKHLTSLNAIVISTWTLFFVGIVAGIVLFSTDFISRINSESLYPLMLIIVLGAVNSGLAAAVFNYVMQISSPVFASSVTYLIPVVATFNGFFDGEAISMLHYLGMAVILVGVYLINKK
jgi:drug/metabolite transporter (DMT)-like permease